MENQLLGLATLAAVALLVKPVREKMTAKEKSMRARLKAQYGDQPLHTVLAALKKRYKLKDGDFYLTGYNIDRKNKKWTIRYRGGTKGTQRTVETHGPIGSTKWKTWKPDHTARPLRPNASKPTNKVVRIFPPSNYFDDTTTPSPDPPSPDPDPPSPDPPSPPVCNPGSQLVNGSCVPIDPVCGPGYQMVNGQCQPIPQPSSPTTNINTNTNTNTNTDDVYVNITIPDGYGSSTTVPVQSTMVPYYASTYPGMVISPNEPIQIGSMKTTNRVEIGGDWTTDGSNKQVMGATGDIAMNGIPTPTPAPPPPAPSPYTRSDYLRDQQTRDEVKEERPPPTPSQKKLPVSMIVISVCILLLVCLSGYFAWRYMKRRASSSSSKNSGNKSNSNRANRGAGNRGGVLGGGLPLMDNTSLPDFANLNIPPPPPPPSTINESAA
jgi:hypothetical protein